MRWWAKLKTNYIYILIQVNYNIIVFYCCVVFCVFVYMFTLMLFSEKSLNKNKSEIHIFLLCFVYMTYTDHCVDTNDVKEEKARTIPREIARQNDIIYPISLPTSSSKIVAVHFFLNVPTNNLYMMMSVVRFMIIIFIIIYTDEDDALFECRLSSFFCGLRDVSSVQLKNWWVFGSLKVVKVGPKWPLNGATSNISQESF